MKPLTRKLLRDLWHIRGQAFAVAMVVAAGVAVFVMSQGTLHSLEETRAAYYERYRFADVFARVKRAPQATAAEIAAIDGVKASETRIVEEVTLDIPGIDEPAMGRLVSVPEQRVPMLNALVLRDGRLVAAGHPDEVVVSEAFAEAHGFHAGDLLSAIVNGKKRRLTIVGTALSPEYVYSIGPGQLVPDNRLFGILWMGRDALAAAFDLEGAFNEVSLSLRRGAIEAEVIDDLDTILERYGGTGAYGRIDQISHAFLDGELEQLKMVGRIIPPIFLAVAAFLLNVVASRLVDTEREQIGLLKAFGYSNLRVGGHYLAFVLAIVFAGVAVGMGAGAWLGQQVIVLYAEFYRFPFLQYQLNPDVFVQAGLIALAAGVAAAVVAVRRAVRLQPAVAMAPAAPPIYRRSLIETLPMLGRLGTPSRMIVRHLLRWPVRTAITIIGISFSAALLVGTLFFYDSIEALIDLQYNNAQRQDVTVTFTEARPSRVIEDIRRLPGVLSAEPYRDVAVRLRHGRLSERVAITGLATAPDMRRLLTPALTPVSLPESGLVLSSKLAELLGVGRGDLLTVEVLEGKRPVRRLPVTAVVEEYIATPAYAHHRVIDRLMDEDRLVSGAMLQVDATMETELYQALKDTPQVAGVALQRAAVQSFRETMAESIGIILGFYIFFGSLIAVGTVYNSARVALSERGRELASLRVLGFTRFEVSYILLGELALQTLIALPLGCVLGYGLASLMTASIDSKLFRVPLVIEDSTYGLAILVVVLSTVVTGLLVRRRIDRLDLIAVLKTRE